MDGAHHMGKPVAGRNTVPGAMRLAFAALVTAALLTGPVAGQERFDKDGLELVAPPVRNVTPPGILPGPEVDGPLYREPTPPPPPEPPRWRRFFLPVTTDSATFVTKDGLVIVLYGVAPLPVDLVCTRANGEDWPCGKTALFSLRRFLRGRAIECYLPPLDGIDRAVAPCRIGKIDIAHWLIRQGWALPDDETGADYDEAARDARCDRLGKWRGAEPDPACPEPEPAPDLG